MIRIQQITKEDITHLVGRYIIEFDIENDADSLERNIAFFAEKRISMVCSVTVGISIKYFLQGYSYNHSKLLTADEFVSKFNDNSKNRYHRLMTKEEVDILTEYSFNESKFIF